MTYSYTQHWVKTHLQNIQGQIQDELDSSKLNISNQKIPFELENKSKAIHEEEQSYKKIQIQKQRLEKEMYELKEKQKQMIMKRRKSRSLNHSEESEELSKRQNKKKSPHKTRNIKQRLDEFEESLKVKDRKYEKWRENEFMKDRENFKKQKQSENEEKRELIGKRLEELRQKSEQRRQKILKEKKQYKKLQQNKKLFQKLEEDWKKEQEKDEMLLKQQIMKNRLNHMLDYTSMKEHQEKYDQLLQQMKRNKEINEKSRVESNQSRAKHHPSKFYEKVLSEKRKEEIEEIKKNEEKRRIRENKEKYIEYVKGQILPKLKMRKAEEPIPKKLAKSSREIRDIGVHYLREDSPYKEKKRSQSVLAINPEESMNSFIEKYNDQYFSTQITSNNSRAEGIEEILHKYSEKKRIHNRKMQIIAIGS